MIKHFLTTCMVFVLPLIAISLFTSFLSKEAIDWENIYIMTVSILVCAIIMISAHDKRQRVKTETKFNYTAFVRRGPIIFLVCMLIVNTTVSVKGVEIETSQIRIVVIIAAIIFLTFLKFKFYIEDKTLTYVILFFTIQIYKRSIYPEEIKRVKFVRTGWAKKGAIIKVENGFNIRIINFEPTNICADLNGFADKHSISVLKPYDYMLLEKSSRK